MIFSLSKTVEILEKTPTVLLQLVRGLSDEWVFSNEGEGTWSVFDVIGHLIHGEKTDWMTRTEIILFEGDNKNFKEFDRFAQFTASKGKTLYQLLEEFKQVRENNLERLHKLNLSEKDYNKTGIHPAFGAVTLSQLLSTWVVHDLDHIAQISRIMAKQYKDQTGPWINYLKILKQ